ncbi:ATP-dependent dethiobiotin synthetase BioD [Vibrio sp. MACH09]|uniref:dethiobiotin synthase n=1 Tax=unclassified Vibrio TaxID=2614977 RepID=UPI00149364A6|nr:MULTISPECIES: dethiobiotin synthase [unclassified Vibrio]NOI66320.1 dethiobiotin synthase [Vibrio sp. 99-8-1]GLO60457.1 ATP-dependent dethiobiotin synthetase BioD [Vibrio sp. MACH09]
MIDTFFIAGTDTEVGKTVVSKAILQALAAHGLTTIGYKPVAAGCKDSEDGRRNSDALHLQQAATREIAYDDVNPYALLSPTSPHIAAKQEEVVIDYSVLSDKLQQHKQTADVVLVEGAGGWRVPISQTDCLSTWVKQEKMPVVLVVGIKLGCLSHAMLSVEAIQNDGLEIIGWAANRINPGTENYSEIIRMLEEKIPAPKLGEIPYVPSVKKRDIGKFMDITPILNG